LLVHEDSDEDRLYFGRAVPRAWMAAGQSVRLEQAPTRWGRVNFVVTPKLESLQLLAQVELPAPGAPAEIQVSLRAPKGRTIQRVTVNGRPATLAGRRGDAVVIRTGGERHFEVVGELA